VFLVLLPLHSLPAQGFRLTLYKRCTHEHFRLLVSAPWDGLVERLTRYADDARHVVLEVRCLGQQAGASDTLR